MPPSPHNIIPLHCAKEITHFSNSKFSTEKLLKWGIGCMMGVWAGVFQNLEYCLWTGWNLGDVEWNSSTHWLLYTNPTSIQLRNYGK